MFYTSDVCDAVEHAKSLGIESIHWPDRVSIDELSTLRLQGVLARLDERGVNLSWLMVKSSEGNRITHETGLVNELIG